MEDTNINDAFIVEPPLPRSPFSTKPLWANTPLAMALGYKGPLYEFTREWCLFNIESNLRKLSAI